MQKEVTDSDHDMTSDSLVIPVSISNMSISLVCVLFPCALESLILQKYHPASEIASTSAVVSYVMYVPFKFSHGFLSCLLMQDGGEDNDSSLVDYSSDVCRYVLTALMPSFLLLQVKFHRSLL